MRTSFLALLVSLAPACALTRSMENDPLETAAFQELRPGTSTAREVVERLGAPTEVVQLGKRSAYRYEFTQAKRAVLFLVILAFQNEDRRSDRAWLFFDENQVLTHVGTTFEGEHSEYAMPWEEVHD